MYEIRLVCEGPTDAELLRAILDARLDDEYRLVVLQPEGSAYGGDAGPHGGGWKGVRGWCTSVADAGGLYAVAALSEDVDLLVIHVDADIAVDREIAVARACPPALPTVLALEAVVSGWLRLETLPAKIALWIPAMSSEAWLLRAFFPNLPEGRPCEGVEPGGLCVECNRDPARVLLHRDPRFVRMHGGRLKKQRRVYGEHRSSFAQQWPDVVEHCSAARRLEDQLQAQLGPRSSE